MYGILSTLPIQKCLGCQYFIFVRRQYFLHLPLQPLYICPSQKQQRQPNTESATMTATIEARRIQTNDIISAPGVRGPVEGRVVSVTVYPKYRDGYQPVDILLADDQRLVLDAATVVDHLGFAN
jgi:hypothetical protein